MIKKIIVLCLLISFLGYTQEAKIVDKSNNISEQIFNSVEVLPEPPGGVNSFRQYVASELLHYLGDIKEKLQVNLKIRFVVNEEGKLTNFEILEETVNKYNLGKRAIFVLKNCPNWKPGYMNGRAVKVYYVFPLKFNIDVQ